MGLARSWKGVRFLCYHNVVEKNEALPLALRHFSISSDEFENHLRLIDQLGMRVVTMSEAVNVIGRSDADAGRFICITFDDGYMDNFTVAWPILKKHRFSAHFFISSKHIGKSSEALSHMGLEELLSLIKEGGTIGSHSHDHVILTQSSWGNLLEQLSKSKHILEDIVGANIDTFAYPNSQFNSGVIKAVRSAGYRFGFAIGLGTIKRISRSDQYYIVRNIIMGNAYKENQLMIKGAYDWASPYSRIQNRIKAILKG